VRGRLAAAWEAVDAALLWLAFEPAGRWLRWRERRRKTRELRRDVAGTASLALAAAAFLVLIAAVCVAVFVFH